MHLHTLATGLCASVTASALIVSLAGWSPSGHRPHGDQASPCKRATDSETRAALAWWGGVLSDTTNARYRAANNIPRGVLTSTLVTDSRTCAALRARVDSIASAGDPSYARQNLSRSVVVMAAGSVRLLSDPDHPDRQRHSLHHVFTANGTFLSKHYVIP